MNPNYLDFEQPIACVYTSGSTGRPLPHIKTFGRMWLNIQAGAERIWSAAGGACSVVGTSPIRHMYGLESSVFLPILAAMIAGQEFQAGHSVDLAIDPQAKADRLEHASCGSSAGQALSVKRTRLKPSREW